MNDIKVLGDRVLVERIANELKKEGEFQTVEVSDSFIYKGKVVKAPTLMIDIKEGDVIVYAKFSPDTHDLELDGRKLKFVNVTDVLAIL